MRLADLEELRRRKSLQSVKLMEVSDLTAQLMQAAQRQDETSVTLLLSMRDEPVRRLSEMEMSLRSRLEQLSQEDAIRARELLEGGAPRSGEEEALCEQVARYRRLLSTVLDMDRRLSVHMGGKRSFYNTYRD